MSLWHPIANFITNQTSPLGFQQGIIFDIHGQTHPESVMEIGHYLSLSSLSQDYLNNDLKTTINKMRLLNNKKYELNALIRGPDSLGGIMEKYGMRAVPSPSYPKPLSSEFFTGGYTIYAHGSFAPSKYNVNAIQIEFPKKDRLSDTLMQASKNVSLCIFEYYHLHSLNKRF